MVLNCSSLIGLQVFRMVLMLIPMLHYYSDVRIQGSAQEVVAKSYQSLMNIGLHINCLKHITMSEWYWLIFRCTGAGK